MMSCKLMNMEQEFTKKVFLVGTLRRSLSVEAEEARLASDPLQRMVLL